MPKHFSPEERREIEQKLLSAAKESFLYFGVNKTTVADITDKAGVAKGTFYLFFNSKGDIFMKLISDEWALIHDELDRRYMDRQGDLRKIIRGYIAENRRELLGHPLFAMVYDRDAMVMISDRTVQDKLMEFKHMSDGRLVDLIRSWYAANSIQSAVSPEVLSGMIRSTSYLNYHRDEIGEEIFDEVIRQMIEGIALVVGES